MTDEARALLNELNEGGWFGETSDEATKAEDLAIVGRHLAAARADGEKRATFRLAKEAVDRLRAEERRKICEEICRVVETTPACIDTESLIYEWAIKGCRQQAEGP